jgi:pimeloyl-[acyl-carrier protein] methyl ester esterase
MHVDTRGSGPSLVMLHGWAMHGGVFDALADALQERFTVHRVDLPGHGHSRDSTVPLTLDAVTGQLLARFPDAWWMGWSLGGLFALHAALRQPSALRGLVMHCATPCFVRAPAGSGDDWVHGASAEIFEDFARGLATDYHGTLDRFAALEAFGSDDARDAMRTLRAEIFARGQPPVQALVDGLRLLADTDLRPRLPGLAVPSLWLAGGRDRLVDPRAMRMAAGMTPGACYAQIEQAGHAPFLSHAPEVARHIMAFAATTAAGDAEP